MVIAISSLVLLEVPLIMDDVGDKPIKTLGQWERVVSNAIKLEFNRKYFTQLGQYLKWVKKRAALRN